MATIRKHRNKWQAIVRKQGYKPQSKSFLSKADARKWARHIESEIDKGTYLDISLAQKTTLAQLLERYESDVLPSKKSQKPVRISFGIIKNKIGHYSLAQLTPTILAQYRDYRLTTVSNETIRKELSYLRTAINIGIREWSIYLPHGNPMLNVAKPKPSRGRDRRLEAGEEEKLLAELAGNPIMKSIVLLAIETAMRRSELVNVHWKNINIKDRTLLIPKTKTDVPRTIPLSMKAITIIQEQRSIVMNINGKVFNVEADSVTQAFSRACIRAGIEGLRFHDLRHEATSRLFEKGLNPMEVASITGHQDLKMLRRYTHLRAEDLVAKI